MQKRSEILQRQSDGASSIQHLLVELQTVSQTKIFSYIFERNSAEKARAEGLRGQWRKNSIYLTEAAVPAQTFRPPGRNRNLSNAPDPAP